MSASGNIGASGGETVLASMSRRKREIITAIAAAFAARGFHAVGMRDLAADLSLNPGTLYHHFPSKDHALLAICLVGQQETHDNVAQTLATYPGFDARIRALFDAHLSSLQRLGDFLDVFASQRDAVPVPLDAPLQSGWHATRQLFGQLFTEAAARGEIIADADPRNATRLLLGIYRTANILHRSGHKNDVAPFLALGIRMAVRGLSRHPTDYNEVGNQKVNDF